MGLPVFTGFAVYIGMSLEYYLKVCIINALSCVNVFLLVSSEKKAVATVELYYQKRSVPRYMFFNAPDKPSTVRNSRRV